MAALRVFLCYRAADRAEAEGLAAWLRGMGLDVVFDAHQIHPGDDLGAVIERGLSDCGAGVVLASRSGVGAWWTRWAPAADLAARLHAGAPVVVALIDDDARVPVGLRAVARVALADRDLLLARLRGGAGPAPPPIAADAHYQLRIEPDGAGYAWTLRGPDDLRVRVSLDDRPPRVSTEVPRLPPAILGALPRTGGFQLRLELTTPALAALPIELAEAASGRPLALEPGVTVGRELAAPRSPCVELGGPLRVLAVTPPTDGGARGHELASLLDALDGICASAHVTLLDGDGATPAAVGGAVRSRRPHVVHLWHDDQGLLHLPTGPDGVTAAVVTAALIADGAPVPLVVLSGRASGMASAGRRLAAALVTAGLPRVVCAPSSGSGLAAAMLGALYANLAAAPLVGWALATAWRDVERRRSRAAAASDGVGAIDDDAPCYAAHPDAWDAPLFDPDLPGLAPAPVAPVLVGRHAARERVRRAVITRGGHGALVCGMGGVGTSRLVDDVIQRLRRVGWAVAVPASMTAGGLERAVVAAADVALAGGVGDDGLAAEAERVLATRPVVLVLDALHDQLDRDRRLRDRGLAATLGRLVRAASVGAVLAVSRCPIAELRGLLDEVRVGPLADLEIRQLLWQLPALSGRADARALGRALGGHPGVLELADAVARSARPREFAHLRARVARLDELGELDLALAAEPGDDPATRADVARAQAAADIVLEQLLGGLGDADLALVRALAVFDRPVPVAAVIASAPSEDVGDALAGLVARGLVVATIELGEPRWLVPRWISEPIWRRTGGRPGAADRAAARWWVERPGATVDDRRRALDHLIRADDHARACELGEALTAQLRTDGRDLDAQDVGERLVMALAERATPVSPG
ncbi:MAG: toll/interleukin-1 receptor domain-containing protein [Myxococcales bacterium]|nr:toll/interleukin-1 receptor domain-containing protein [Myxococcales bacterium]